MRMLKKTEAKESGEKPLRQKGVSQHGKIPDVEWLFSEESTKEGKEAKNHFLKRFLWRDWWKLFYTTLIYLWQNLPVWVLPLVISDVIDTITNLPEGYVLRLVISGIIVFVAVVLNIPATITRAHCVNKWLRSATAEIKSATIRKLQRLSITYHKQMEEGRIHSKFIRDIDKVEGYYRTVLDGLVPTLVNLIVSLIITLMRAPIVSLFFLVLLPLNVGVRTLFQKRIRRENIEFWRENEKLSTRMTTMLQMLTITKSHGLVANQEAQVNEKITDVKTAGLRLDKTVSIFGSMMWVVSQLSWGICIFFCAFLAIKGVITPGEVVLFQSLFSSISGSLLSLINLYPNLISGQAGAHSLAEVICADDIEDDGNRKRTPKIQGAIDFENVCYHYPNEDKYVVQDFNLSVKAGERIAFVGASGSGKSTMMNLIIGLLSPTSGRIIVDGTPLSDMPMQAYRKHISVVPQNSILFSGSIRENITYGLTRYSEKKLKKAVEDANVSEFLPLLEGGLDAQVGERGDKLSGGQKQRVSIARALIRNPRILILDEATSALDNVSEYHVQKAIDNLVQERTTFIVAHRLSTIRNADRIVVMEDGKMVEVGTYEELTAKNGKFAELERLSRIREEEAKAALESL